MRQYPGKDFATWLDFSGNYLRFQDQWDALVESGVDSLCDDIEQVKDEPSRDNKEAAKCHRCGCLWGPLDTCQNCGMQRIRRNSVAVMPGKLSELMKSEVPISVKTDFYAQLLGHADEKGYKPGWAYHKYMEKYKVAPMMAKPKPVAPTFEMHQWIKSRQIAFFKGRANG